MSLLFISTLFNNLLSLHNLTRLSYCIIGNLYFVIIIIIFFFRSIFVIIYLTCLLMSCRFFRRITRATVIFWTKLWAEFKHIFSGEMMQSKASFLCVIVDYCLLCTYQFVLCFRLFDFREVGSSMELIFWVLSCLLWGCIRRFINIGPHRKRAFAPKKYMSMHDKTGCVWAWRWMEDACIWVTEMHERLSTIDLALKPCLNWMCLSLRACIVS